MDSFVPASQVAALAFFFYDEIEINEHMLGYRVKIARKRFVYCVAFTPDFHRRGRLIQLVSLGLKHHGGESRSDSDASIRDGHGGVRVRARSRISTVGKPRQPTRTMAGSQRRLVLGRAESVQNERLPRCPSYQ